MKRNSYWPSRKGDQVVWLTNYMNRINDVSTALGLSPTLVTATKADCGWLVYVIGAWLPAARLWAQSCTDASDEAQSGNGGAVQVLPVFNPPTLPAGAAAVNPGALNRIFIQVQQIKDSGKCTDAIAQELGIVGTQDTGPDFSTLAPELTVEMDGDHVFVGWGWGGYGKWLDSCEIWVDRGDSRGFGLLTIGTTPGFTDIALLLTAPAKWTYKAIYRVGDGQVGLWSALVSLKVGG